jgi:hypothetical protein
MDVSAAWPYGIEFANVYDETYAGKLVWGQVTGLTGSEEKIFPQHINVNEYCDPDYVNYVVGTWFDLSDAEYEYVGEGDGQTLGRSTNYFVDVHILEDGDYLFCRCHLREDGTWRSKKFITVTGEYPDITPNTGEDTGEMEAVTYSYWETIPVTAAGFKEFRLALSDGTNDYL